MSAIDGCGVEWRLPCHAKLPYPDYYQGSTEKSYFSFFREVVIQFIAARQTRDSMLGTSNQETIYIARNCMWFALGR
jgi:hypothetical protein